jgi:outer membrane protein assembly factor BamA
MYVVEGERKRLRDVEFEGLKKTREDLAVKLTGLRPGSRYDGADLEEAYLRLSASGLFEHVEYPEVRVSPKGEGVEALIRVVEATRRNNFSFALGYADREADKKAVFSGMVQLDVSNIGGSLRDFNVFWRNDGADRSETRLGFRQRFLFGYPLAAGITLEQIGLDTLYTWQSLGLDAAAPVGRLKGGLLETNLGVNADRNTFSVGNVSKTVRLRLRGGLSYTMGHKERGTYFKLDGRGTYAHKSLDERDTGNKSSLAQYIIETTLWFAAEPFSHVHVTNEIHFKNIGTEEQLVPLSEQYYIGGAATLRGYRENQFHSRRVAYARNELLVGRSRVEHGYVFLDVGYFLDEEDDGTGTVTSTNRFKLGHGFGLRTASPAGRIDISFGLGEQFSLRQTKVHVILDRSF